MCDDLIHQGLVGESNVSRRSFGVILATAAGSLALPQAAFATGSVVERDVEIKTHDGLCDAVLFHPAGEGHWPAVLMWPDILGLRPVFRDMWRRLAAQGYVVLVPNPFYRSKRAPIVDGPFDFNNAQQRNLVFGYRAAMTDSGVDGDAVAMLSFLDNEPATNKAARAGVLGYCMGGALSFRTAAALPARIGAVGSFHGGNGLVTKDADSPHLLIDKTQAAFLVCQARNDDTQQPETKDVLKRAFAAAKRPATVEVFPADHGWCVPGGQTYDDTQAERAWSALTAMFRSVLV